MGVIRSNGQVSIPNAGSADPVVVVNTAGEPIPVSDGMRRLFYAGFSNGVPSGAYLSSTVGATGTVTASDGMLVVSSGTNAGGFAAARAKRVIPSFPTQSRIMRWSAIYDAAKANSIQLVGPQTAECGFGIGYDGESFGVFHKSGGVRAVYTLTIGTGTGGSETLTVTANGGAVEVTVSTTRSTEEVAAIIAKADFESAGGGWRVSALGNVVKFVNYNAAPTAGAFSFSSTGTAAGTWAQVMAGVVGADTWIPQTSWNHDKLDGTGPSEYTLDPNGLNEYEIEYTDTVARFYVNPGFDREPVLVHKLSATTGTLLQNKTLQFQMVAYNAGNTTDMQVKVGGFSAYVRGSTAKQTARRSFPQTGVTVGTSLAPLITIKPEAAFDGRAFIAPTFVPWLSVSSEGNKSVAFTVLLNATLGDDAVWEQVNATGSTIYDTTATTYSGGVPIAGGVTGVGAQRFVDLIPLDVNLYAGDSLTIVARAAGASTAAAFEITWQEDRD